MSYSHLFDSCAAAYAAYRPHYPAKLYERIYDFCDFQGKPQTAQDIATGSGQAAVELAKKFVKACVLQLLCLTCAAAVPESQTKPSCRSSQ